MKERMKNMKRIVMIIMAVALVALPTMAQKFKEHDQQSMQFQSTSTMAPVNSQYSAQPMLNEDGTAIYNASEATQTAQAPSGPRKIGGVTPTTDPSPVGDAVLPLMLMALAYLGMRVFRARKRA